MSAFLKNKKHTPKAQTPRPKGFALIIALTMMSFMVILVLSLATFLNVEMHTASHQNKLDDARQNAILGAQIALGQLQILTGPDQRVTAPATVAYPDKANLGLKYGDDESELWQIFRENASGLPKYETIAPPEGWKTYLAEDFDFTNDASKNPSPGREKWEVSIDQWWKNKNPHWIGVWKSDELEANGDFNRAQTPQWLISGDGNLTPDQDLDALDIEYVELVGLGSAVPLEDENPDDDDHAISTDGMDGRVIAPTVNIIGVDGLVSGKYAYWIGDENLKANYAVTDPYYNNENRSSIEYRNRLQVPQRVGWELSEGFKKIFESYTEDERAKKVNDEQFSRLASTDQIPLIDTTYAKELRDATRINFHNITGYSQGIFTDTARGGLQKDLFYFLETGNGLSMSDPIPNPGKTDPLNYNNDLRLGIGNKGFPNSFENIPTWGEIYDWYHNVAAADGEGTVKVSDNYFPVISQFRLFNGLGLVGNNLNFYIAPQVVLWNPYDAGLQSAEYELRIKIHPEFHHLRIASRVQSSKLNADDTEIRGELDPNHEQVRTYKRTVYESNGNKNDPLVLKATQEEPYYFHTISGSGSIENFDATLLKITDSHVNSNPVVSYTPPTAAPDFEPPTEKYLPVYNIEVLPKHSELVMKFSASFDPGETLIFTVLSDKEFTSAGSNADNGKIIEIELENGFDADDPSAAYIHIASVNNLDGSSMPSHPELNVGLTPTVLGRSVWAADSNILDDRSIFDIEMHITPEGGSKELYQDPRSFGSIPSNTTLALNGIRSATLTMDTPQRWRRLWSNTNRPADSGSLNTLFHTNKYAIAEFPDWDYVPTAPETFLYGVGSSHIEPTLIDGDSRIYTDSALRTTYRMFANFNVMAKKFSEMHPVVDELRTDGYGNGDSKGLKWYRFGALYAFRSTSTGGQGVRDAFHDLNWDAGKQTGNSIEKSGDDSWRKINYEFTPGKYSVEARKESTGGATSNVSSAEKGMIWNAGSGSNRSRIEPSTSKTRAFSLVETIKGPDVPTETGWWQPPPVEALDELALRPVRRAESHVISLGQLQHVNLSPFMWQPAYPIGNSEADTYVDREHMAGLTSRPVYAHYQPDTDYTPLQDKFGNNLNDKYRQFIPDGVPNNSHNHLIDMSYLLNDAIWDRYFLSTIDPSLSDLSNESPLPNSRIKFYNHAENPEDVHDFDEAAAYVFNNGAFNVNSTSVEAWKALLFAFRNLHMPTIEDDQEPNPENTVPVVRSLAPLEEPVQFSFDDISTNQEALESMGAVDHKTYSNYSKVVSGYRYLTDDMIQVLAERIVDEVRMRGPFYSMADFVNRRLVKPDGQGDTSSAWYHARVVGDAITIDDSYDALAGLQGINGALQRAINVSGINGGVNYPTSSGVDIEFDHVYSGQPYSNGRASNSSRGEWAFGAYPSIQFYTDTEHKAGAPVGEQGLLFSHAPGFVTQADLLTMLGPLLRPRGDTFIIRTYGSAINKLTQEVEAEAWLELHVQRFPTPVVDENGNFVPDENEAEDDDAEITKLGREYRIVDFRWLNEDDV